MTRTLQRDTLASLRAALATARADVGLHDNERIYNNGYADGLAAALALVGAPPATREATSLDDKLELIADLLEIARAIVGELECGETVETDADADVAIEEARDHATRLLAAARGEA